MRQIVRRGTLDLTWPDGSLCRYGAGLPHVAVELTDPRLPRRLVLDPDLALGEAYMDRSLIIREDDLYGLFDLLLGNPPHHRAPRRSRPDLFLHQALRRFAQYSPSARARANAAHHYDLSDALYERFLDADRQYSCAYFRAPDDTLEEAQAQKKTHIATKLLLRPGQRVLDIGCGWGGLALSLARDHGVSVMGITLSEEQLAYATARARETGLADRVTFRLADYRDIAGTFDRIVSVGMFEHVGIPHYRSFFATLTRLLADDGVALVHTIGRTEPPASKGRWLRKYIFPGGYAPALSEIAAAFEKERLWPTDIEVWRFHYAETLRHRRSRFEAREAETRAIYDGRFCRMWRYYLTASELAFRAGRQAVFQVQLARKRDAVPLTRDYLYPGRPHVSRRAAAE
ncbi:cyclopropane-fatty-acyl-phospholipid synthase family protein [Frigidibacter sp. SD6-1]|uniref:SAM-dependent methyltransferase n=1 Tax=Frigidibacter sp. SD6-1 TaxID=3032581 RepID=UPI0024DF3D91|nr:cyclopropane-fatty-acyl-phospholipid synthase family protein [Frigidibacter sp. SD6-1]